MEKLKHKEIAGTRERMFREQNGICLLCKRGIKDPVLDHDHDEGNIRAVLCRTCNSLEGKIENWIKRFGGGIYRIDFINGLRDYWMKDYTGNPIHPKHRTADEKEILKLKRRLKEVKKQETKDKIQRKINQLEHK